MKKIFIIIIGVLFFSKPFAQTAPAYTSLAIGTNTIASGSSSFASGTGSRAEGIGATAFGRLTNAGGQYSFVIGDNSSSSGNNSVAMGVSNRAGADYSIAIGNTAWATGKSSFAIGNYVTTNGKSGSFFLGDLAGSSTWTSTPFGNDADNQMMMRFAGGYRFHLENSRVPFAINPNGTVAIDHSNLNNGNINTGLIFGNQSGEGIASKRTPGGNQYGLDFYSNFSSKLSITNSGNIGIGISTPTAKFSLAMNGEELGGNAHSPIFKTYSGVLGTNQGAEVKLASFGFKSGNWSALGISGYRFIGADGWTNAAIVFGYDVDNTPRAGNFFALAGNGNFGIGTASPLARLQVMGNIVATGTVTPSDVRYKKDISLVKNALNKIKSISGYYYSFKTNEFPEMAFETKSQIGVIAQEVEKVVPEAITTFQNGYKAVDYSKLIPLLIMGMKEQQQQIEELKKLVAELIKNK